VTIDRDQHFFTRNSGLFCTTAPIFDEHGDLAAALDVSSARADLTEGFARLIASAVADAARFIEAENFRLAFPKARILLAPTGDRYGSSLLAVDRDDLVIGATRAARIGLGVNSATLKRPTPAADLMGRAAPKATTLVRRNALSSNARSRARAATCPRGVANLRQSPALVHREGYSAPSARAIPRGQRRSASGAT
jgi:transcriptional regulator of acetoin/glycerol metabolism